MAGRGRFVGKCSFFRRATLTISSTATSLYSFVQYHPCFGLGIMFSAKVLKEDGGVLKTILF